MSKTRKKADNDRQMSLLDLVTALHNREAERESGAAAAEGEMDISERLRQEVREGIRLCGLSRFQIAGEMSHLMGREVAKTTIDTWTAESKEGHRIPGDAIPAFCAVTKYNGPVRLLVETSGLFALPGPDALRAEIRRLEEDRRKIVAEKHKRELFLKEMEGK